MSLKQLKGGNSLTVTLAKRTEDSIGQVDAEAAAKQKKGLDLSGKDQKKALHILRKGNVKVEKNIIDMMLNTRIHRWSLRSMLRKMMKKTVKKRERKARRRRT